MAPVLIPVGGCATKHKAFTGMWWGYRSTRWLGAVGMPPTTNTKGRAKGDSGISHTAGRGCNPPFRIGGKD